MPTWLLKLLQPLYSLFIDRVMSFLKDKFKEFMQSREDKRKIREILNDKDPVTRAKRLRDYLNS